MYQEINSVKKTNGERIGVDHKLLNTSYHSSIFNCAEFMDRRSLGSRLFLEAQHNVNLFSIGKTKDQKINQRDILGHTGCVNAVEFNKEETLLASGGDDMRVFVWNVSDLMMHKNPNPAAIMEMGHHSNIFSYQFSLDGSDLYSGGNDGVLIRHDVKTGKPLSVHDDGTHAIYSISANPVDTNIVAASRENGLITFYDRREDSSSKDGRMVIEQNCQIFRSQFNPANSSTFAIASNNGLHLYDLRMPKEVLVDLSDIVPESIYVEWNRTGTAVAALQSHKFPIYIDFVQNRRVRLKDRHYENVHTIKSVTFMDDNTVVTGSDDFNIYAWRIPDKEEHTDKMRKIGIHMYENVCNASFVLKGHRSIVNHVRYSPCNKLLASCGVEKIVKCWSALELPYSYDVPRIREPKFDTWHYPGVENNVPVETTAEDEQMLHYFDRLVMSTRHHTEYDSPFSDIEVGDIGGELMHMHWHDMVELENISIAFPHSSESSEDDNNHDLEPDSDSDSGGDDEAEEKRLQNERIARRRRWELRQRGSSDSSTDSDEDKSKRRRLQSSDLITSDEESEGSFAMYNHGLPIDQWPPVRNHSP